MPRSSMTGRNLCGSRYGETRASPVLPSGCQTHQGAKGSWRRTDEQSPLALHRCAGKKGILLFCQSSCRKFSNNPLGKFEPLQATLGSGRNCQSHSWLAGSKNGREPHVTSSASGSSSLRQPKGILGKEEPLLVMSSSPVKVIEEHLGYHVVLEETCPP